MHQRGKESRHGTKSCNRIRRHRFEPARHHRVARPDEGCDERRDQSRHLARSEVAAAIAGKQQHGAGKAERGADDMMRRQPLARQQRGEQHDQKRPEIVQQPRLGRRRKAQRQEI